MCVGGGGGRGSFVRSRQKGAALPVELKQQCGRQCI